MSNRVNSVRKAQNERLINNLEGAGLPAALADLHLSIKIDTTDTINELPKKLFTSVKGKLQKGLYGMTVEQVQDYADSISFGQQKIVTIRPLSNKEGDYYFIKLLFAVLRMKPSDENIESFIPAEICIQDEKGEKIGYTFVRHSLKKTFHGTRRKLTGMDGRYHNYEYLFDLATLLSNTLIKNSLVQFALLNEEVIQYSFVKHLIESSHHTVGEQKYFSIPFVEPFKTDCLKLIKEYHLADGYEVNEKIFHGSIVEDFYFAQADNPSTLFHNGHSHFEKIVTLEMLLSLNYIQEKTKRENDEITEHARAFETKKHINLSHQARMKENAFLARYEYVELDSDTDLDKFHTLEKEFRALTKKVFIPYSDGSFRIKKLGRHRAAGIYFSHVNATIFDLDHPDAFVHEMMHQIDYTMMLGNKKRGLLSETIAFRPIIEKYKELVQRSINELPDDHFFKTLWKGKTKYNASYYFQPTEIFARSGELYFHHKGIETSFLKSNYTGCEYPHDESYINLITEYFDRLFSMFEMTSEKSREEKKVAAASSPTPFKPTEVEWNIKVKEDEGQLSFELF